MKKEKILFVSVHPDDETLGCGGTIIKLKNEGISVNWLNLTGGSLDHPYGFSKEILDNREKLITLINQTYGFESFINLNYPSQMLDTLDARIIIGGIKEAYDEILPDTLFIPNRSDIHSDHRVAFDALFSAAKQFRASYIKRIYMYETLSETEFALSLIERVFIPNTFVDISDHFEEKIRIMQMYDTEIMPDPYPRSIHAIKSLAAYRGSRIGTTYAEAFMNLFEVK